MDVAGDEVVEVRVMCAWCGRLIREGEGGAEVSHGLCEECAADDPLEVGRREDEAGRRRA